MALDAKNMTPAAIATEIAYGLVDFAVLKGVDRTLALHDLAGHRTPINEAAPYRRHPKPVEG